jgi:hypothetical protein
MQELVKEFNKIIPDSLCEDIIDKYEENETRSTASSQIIEKGSIDWKKIERIIYRELLFHLNQYKTELIQQRQFTENCMEMIECLNKPLYVKEFAIQKLNSVNSSIQRIHNRYNVITFFLFLNDAEDGIDIILDNNSILPRRSNLLFFPDNMTFSYRHDIHKPLYIISGQFCSENVVQQYTLINM